MVVFKVLETAINKIVSKGQILCDSITHSNGGICYQFKNVQSTDFSFLTGLSLVPALPFIKKRTFDW